MDPATEQAGSPSSSARPRPRIQYACEACRIAKAKCMPSNTGAICQRCSTSKRECIFKPGPRARRRRSKLHPAATRKTPPPSAPSRTFTIDVPMPVEDGADIEPSDSLNALCDAHEGFLDDLMPEQGPSGDIITARSSQPQSTVSGHESSSSTPSVSSRSVHGFSSVQPQFNLDSAASLLESFREGMLPHFPVIVLTPGVTISSLARNRPFVLLAILAAASGGRSLQGHSLYDEEFRKVLGLKFVSGGERSLELLVGLLIYCAWYPFHLRPKNRQARQYLRMAMDIVHDLELDQASHNEDVEVVRAEQQRVAGIRAYVSCYYLCSSFASTFAKNHSIPFQQWTATCCDILESVVDDASAITNQTLAWLVRLAHIAELASNLTKRQDILQHEDQHELLMVTGMEAQLREWQARMSLDVSTKPVLKMANMFTQIVLDGFQLLEFPRSNKQKREQMSPGGRVDPSRLLACAHGLRTWYEYIASLPEPDFANFAGTDWTRLIVAVILGLRLSFPIPDECPGWDHAVARRVLGLGTFLHVFSGDDGDKSGMLTPAPGRKSPTTGVLSASRVVFGVVRRKYERRLAAIERAAAMEPPHPMPPDEEKGIQRCPMFDRSLGPYLNIWDDSLPNTTNLATPALTISSALVTGSVVVDSTGSSPQIQPMIFHDLWATMTMGWSQQG